MVAGGEGAADLQPYALACTSACRVGASCSVSVGCHINLALAIQPRIFCRASLEGQLWACWEPQLTTCKAHKCLNFPICQVRISVSKCPDAQGENE